MRIDIPERKLVKAIKMLGMIEGMDFPEIEDGNKMDKIFQIQSWAEEFKIDIQEEADL